jgi:hypothetical protein
MRLRVCSIIGLFLLTIGAVAFKAGSPEACASTIQSDNPPRIFSARMKGRKLILTGENFAPGAVVVVNGQPQKTRNDEESPSTILIAKKAGKFIPDNTAVDIQVQSANTLSEKFSFFKGLVVTLEDVGKPISLRVGDRFLLFLSKADYEFTSASLDESILKKVTDVDVPGSQGVFEAVRPGNTKLIATGERPCAKAIPPCLAPAIYAEFNVIVE